MSSSTSSGAGDDDDDNVAGDARADAAARPRSRRLFRPPNLGAAGAGEAVGGVAGAGTGWDCFGDACVVGVFVAGEALRWKDALVGFLRFELEP